MTLAHSEKYVLSTARCWGSPAAAAALLNDGQNIQRKRTPLDTTPPQNRVKDARRFAEVSSPSSCTVTLATACQPPKSPQSVQQAPAEGPSSRRVTFSSAVTDADAPTSASESELVIDMNPTLPVKTDMYSDGKLILFLRYCGTILSELSLTY